MIICLMFAKDVLMESRLAMSHTYQEHKQLLQLTYSTSI